MAKVLGMALSALLAGGAAYAQPPVTNAPPVPTNSLDQRKLSYAIGFQIGQQFADGDPKVDLPTLERAIEDAYHKRTPTVSASEMDRQLRALEAQMHDESVKAFTQLAAVNARKSRQFMAKNRQQAGVVQLPSGIQYQVIKKGAGEVSPSVLSQVTVNYRGMLPDGTEFDSTWAHGAPVSFDVSGVIPGWRDVIPRMHVGDRWMVVIPPRLAYGEHGALPRIGPNEALVFDIELLDIKHH